jgi:hypothetical protein
MMMIWDIVKRTVINGGDSDDDDV